jgi:signal transduction histidine kinase
MKKIFTLFFLTVIAVSSFAQDKEKKIIDSLKITLLKTKEDTTKIKIINQIANTSLYSKPDFAVKQSAISLKLAQKINYKEGIISSFINLGIANCVKSDYTKGLDYLYKALTIADEINEKPKLILIYNNIGILFNLQKNHKKALFYYNKGLQLSIDTKNKEYISLYLNNIGDIYIQQKKYQKALSFFNKALVLTKELKNRADIGLNLTNIGFCYNGLKNYSKGIAIINESTKTINEETNFYNGYNTQYLGIAYYQLALNEKNKAQKENYISIAILNLEKSIRIFNLYQSDINIQESYFNLFKVNKLKGDFKNALNNFEKYTDIKNSIFSEENKNKLANLESQREIELRDKKIEIQNLKIKNEARKVYLLYTITVAVIVLLGLFLWLYLSKRKTNSQLNDKNKIISNINKQKDKFFSIIAHDLRGPFNGFLGLTELLAENIDDMEKDEIQFAAVNMRSSAVNLNRLLENLLEWSRMEQGLIPFSPQENNLPPIVNESVAILEASANKKEIKILTKIPEETNVFADHNILQAVIRNILSNAVKFTPKGGTITIQGKEDNKNTTIAIKDSGIGMNAKMIENLFQLDVKTNRKGTDDEPSTGLGLILCKEFVEKHGGKIWVESEENIGSTFYFSFPKHNLTNTL